MAWYPDQGIGNPDAAGRLVGSPPTVATVEGQRHLEVARVTTVLEGWRDPRAALTPVERERAARYATPALQDEFTAAHLVARTVVGELLGVRARSVVLEQRCPECGGEHGKPHVRNHPEVHVSWSHSHGWVGAAASHLAVGIDLEAPWEVERALEPGLLRRTATPEETAIIEAAADPRAAFLRMWVLKESLIKVGRIALADFARADVSTDLVLGCQVELHPHPVVTVGTATVLEDQ